MYVSITTKISINCIIYVHPWPYVADRCKCILTSFAAIETFRLVIHCFCSLSLSLSLPLFLSFSIAASKKIDNCAPASFSSSLRKRHCGSNNNANATATVAAAVAVGATIAAAAAAVACLMALNGQHALRIAVNFVAQSKNFPKTVEHVESFESLAESTWSYNRCLYLACCCCCKTEAPCTFA